MSDGAGELVATDDEGTPDSRALAPLPTSFGDWVCARMALEGEDTFVVQFASPGTADWVEVTVVPSSAPGPAFRRFERCNVRYRGRLESPSEARRAEVAALVVGVGASIDGRLAASPSATIAEALGRAREAGPIVFGRDALRALLAPDIVDGVPVAGGWTLVDVYPTSYLNKSDGTRLELVLDFRRARDLRRVLFVVGERSDARPAFAKTEHFSVSYMSLGGAEPAGAQTLRALVGFALGLRDHEALEVLFPDVASDIARALLPSGPAPVGGAAPAPAWLNLAINSECSQSCAFCSIKETSPAQDGGDGVLGQLLADLAAGRRRGVTGLRVNGYDPLSYSRVLDVLRFATKVGYERADVFSPCTLLADRAFCDAVVDASPPVKKFYVPLYGADAASHDRVVARDGAFALATRAIENLVERVGERSVLILSVATRGNLEALAGAADYARSHGLSFSAHMPYPSFESRADKYFGAAPRQRDVVAAFAPFYARSSTRTAFPVEGVAPCVTLRAMRAAGVAPKRWLDVPDAPLLTPGAEYRDAKFSHGPGEREKAAFVAATVPCPHAASCALESACSAELLRSYVELFGADEFSAVSLGELIAAT